jgi:hypothetical protein
MATSAEAAALVAEQLAETEDDAIRVAIRTALLNVHTHLPGTIKSFDAATQTATVQPNIKAIYVALGAVALPPIPKVPVLVLGGGGGHLSFPVEAGDECLLLFSERAIDNWFQAGGVQEPSDDRVHDLTDAFAIVGFRSLKNALGEVPDDGVLLRAPNGKVVYLGGSTGIGVAAPKALLKAGVISGAPDPLDPFIIWATAVGAFTGAGPPQASWFTTTVKGK